MLYVIFQATWAESIQLTAFVTRLIIESPVQNLRDIERNAGAGGKYKTETCETED